MRVLITPLVRKHMYEAAPFMADNIAELLFQRGHTVALSSPKPLQYSHAGLYPSQMPKKKLFRRESGGRSYEEWLYDSGACEAQWLQNDMTHLLETIDAFQPDLIITLDRITAVSAAKVKGIPCYSVVHSAMYRNANPPANTLKHLNALLSSYKLEQVFSLQELYEKCDQKIMFGSATTNPAKNDTGLYRIGIPSLYPITSSHQDRLLIALGDLKKGNIAAKAIEEAFHGAPYTVTAWVNQTPALTKDNLHFVERPRLDAIAESTAVIHDGNDYIFQQCIAAGIPQLIIASHEYIRFWNANAAERTGIGLKIYEEDLTMRSLYETYMKLMSDDAYRKNTQTLSRSMHALGDLTKILYIPTY